MRRSSGLARKRLGWALAVMLVVHGTCALALVPTARADTAREYQDKLVLVLDGLRRTLYWVQANLGDRELARFAYPLCERYVQMVERLVPSPEFRLVHPHLVIAAENVERAVDAAMRDDARASRDHARTVREELRTLEGVLEHLHVRLPTIPR